MRSRTPRPVQACARLYETAQLGVPDNERAPEAFCEGSHLFVVLHGRGMDDGPVVPAVGETGGEGIGRFRYENLGELCHLFNGGHGLPEGPGIPALVPYRNPVEHEVLSHPREYLAHYPLRGGNNPLPPPEVRDREEDGRWVVEGLLVPEEDNLVSDRNPPLAHAELHGAGWEASWLPGGRCFVASSRYGQVSASAFPAASFIAKVRQVG